MGAWPRAVAQAEVSKSLPIISSTCSGLYLRYLSRFLVKDMLAYLSGKKNTLFGFEDRCLLSELTERTGSCVTPVCGQIMPLLVLLRLLN